MTFLGRSSPRDATLNVPFNLARMPGAMLIDSGEITGVRDSKVESKTILAVGKQIYYVERQMAKAFGYGVGDKVKVYRFSGKNYFTATKNRDGKKDV